MPWVRVTRLHSGWQGGGLYLAVENAATQALVSNEILGVTPEMVQVDIPAQQERDGDWWKRPLVYVDFAENEVRTDAVMREATYLVCQAVRQCLISLGYQVEAVRGRTGHFNAKTEYVNVKDDQTYEEYVAAS